jgi:hypothetical protein
VLCVLDPLTPCAVCIFGCLGFLGLEDIKDNLNFRSIILFSLITIYKNIPAQARIGYRADPALLLACTPSIATNCSSFLNLDV